MTLRLVSDANVMIDVAVGELVDQMFLLPYEYITPDVLFHQELRDHHPELADKGLQLIGSCNDSGYSQLVQEKSVTAPRY